MGDNLIMINFTNLSEKHSQYNKILNIHNPTRVLSSHLIFPHVGGKSHGAMEGGIRVPTVAMFPGRIPPGLEIKEPTAQFDLFPTVSNLMGSQVPTDRLIDGKDLMPLLTDGTGRSPHQFLFHYCGSAIHGARYRTEEGRYFNIQCQFHLQLVRVSIHS